MDHVEGLAAPGDVIDHREGPGNVIRLVCGETDPIRVGGGERRSHGGSRGRSRGREEGHLVTAADQLVGEQSDHPLDPTISLGWDPNPGRGQHGDPEGLPHLGGGAGSWRRGPRARCRGRVRGAGAIGLRRGGRGSRLRSAAVQMLPDRQLDAGRLGRRNGRRGAAAWAAGEVWSAANGEASLSAPLAAEDSHALSRPAARRLRVGVAPDPARCEASRSACARAQARRRAREARPRGASGRPVRSTAAAPHAPRPPRDRHLLIGGPRGKAACASAGCSLDISNVVRTPRQPG
jgi:hypothetical protein